MKKFTEEHFMTFDKEQDEYIWELDDTWQNSVPEDFYFEVLNGSEVEFASDDESKCLFLFVTPANYFDENGYCFDQHMPIEHLFAPYEFDCTMEGTWEIACSSKEVIEADFINKGFRKNQTFSDIIKNPSGD